jgi:hypothetical protein
MTTTQILILLGTAIGLGGMALAYFKTDRLLVRLASVAVMGAFYVWVVLNDWMDSTWANTTMVAVILIALISLRQEQQAKAARSSKPPTSGEEDS